MSPGSLAWLELLALWAAWWYPFLFRAPHVQRRESITVAGPTRIGLLLEVLAFAFVWFPLPATPRTGVPVLLGGLALGAVGAILGWSAVSHLGKQFRLHAGLYVDHELVRSGPYALVRHPIYASLLVMLLCTALFLASWLRTLVALTIFLAGTEIRVRSEDKLLGSRFGKDFQQYQRRVPAYVPFVR